MKEYRTFARDVFEDKKYNDRTEEAYGRNAAEEEALNERLRQIQKENPNMDLTQLFDTDRAEHARQTQHKKAYASYKAFEFLKHGLDHQKKLSTQQAKKQTPKSAMESKDPYNFPPVEETVAMYLTKDSHIKVIDGGDSLTAKAGRNFFGYTERDFLEAYHGKDLARQPNTDLAANPVFGFNDSLKHRYPIDKLLKAPVLAQQKKWLNEESGLNDAKLY